MHPAQRLAATAALMALIGTAAAAQDAAPEAPAPETPAAEAPEAPAPEAPAAEAPAAATEAGQDAAPADGGAAGEPASADAAAGGDDAEAAGEAGALGEADAPEVLEVVRDTFDDWQVRCDPTGADCFMYQLALDADGNPVAEFSLIRLAGDGEAAAGATVVTPLGTLLPAGLVVQIDSGEQRQYPYSWCSQVGCFARFGFSGETVAAMKRGNLAKLSLASIVAPDRPVTLDISLRGFTAAFDSLEPVAQQQ